jgi:PAS domain S-box-containing protein
MQTDQLEHPSGTDLAGAEDLPQLQATALEVAANPIIISTRDGTIIWVNKAFEQLSGYTRDEALGKSTRLLKSGHQSSSFYKSLWETILSGKTWRGELVNRRKDGSFYQEEMTITPVKNGTGDITHFIAIKLDITERKRAEERICRLAQAVENSAELIAITDPDGRISFANRALLRATGYQESEIVGEFFRRKNRATTADTQPPSFHLFKRDKTGSAALGPSRHSRFLGCAASLRNKRR